MVSFLFRFFSFFSFLAFNMDVNQANKRQDIIKEKENGHIYLVYWFNEDLHVYFLLPEESEKISAFLVSQSL